MHTIQLFTRHFTSYSEVGIYKKTRKHAFDQEMKKKNDKGQQNKKENTLSTMKGTKKDFFYGQERVLSLIFLLSCFLL